MIDNYTIIKNLAKGEYSDVFLVQDTLGKSFVSKVLYHISESSKQLVSSLAKNELNSLRSLPNCKTVQIVASSFEGKHVTSSETKPCLYLISAYCSLGPLSNLISLRPSEETCKFVFRKLINSLDSIHQNQVFHLNIRTENILLDSDFETRLCGFSHSTTSDSSKTQKHSVYTAPECLVFKNVDCRKVDVFAAGVVLFIMVCGNPPFYRASASDRYFKLLQSKNVHFWKIFPRVSEGFKELVTGMLKQDPSERFELRVVKKHPWLNFDYSSEEVDNIRRKLERNNIV